MVWGDGRFGCGGVELGQFTQHLSILGLFVFVRSCSGVLGESTSLGMSAGRSLGITESSQRDAGNASDVMLRVFI